MKKSLCRLISAVCAAVLLLGSASALTVEDTLDLLEQYYVNKLPAAAYQAETVEQVIQAVGDPYTYYMDAESYQAFNSSVEGESKVGIGVAITYKDTGIAIDRIIPGGAAEEAGLEAGDTIVAVDGVSCVPSREGDVTRITGSEGTQVTLEVLRADGSRRTLTLTRRSFTVPTTTAGLLENGFGVLECDSFSSNTAQLFSDAMARFDGQAELWLVDLRGNTGGLASSAVETAGIFAGQGIFLYLRSADGVYYPYLCFDAALTDRPAVVLTDRLTASASEIFAAAMRDYSAGVMVGGRTYGKGVAQRVLDASTHPELFDGDALKVTSYRFYSGQTNTTDGVGVLPTLLVKDAAAEGVALLLRAHEPGQPEGWLRLELNGLHFYVDAAGAKEDEEGQAALAALFAALPPDVPTEISEDGVWTAYSVPQAAAALGLTYTSRWFKDVDGSPYADELNALATYRLLRGAGSKTYQPRRTLTRAELCAMVCYLLNHTASAPASFSDVPEDSWYAPYVAEMAELGLMKGKGNGKFDPDGPVTQQELVTVLGRLANFLNANCRELLGSVTEQQLSDDALASYAGWAKRYAWLLGSGYRDNVDESVSALFFTAPEEAAPQSPVTRGEAGASLYCLLTGLGVLAY